jgi:colicin import membrane protein
MSTVTVETHADKWRALVLALLLHACVGSVLFLGFMWQRKPPSVSASSVAIEATLITLPSDVETTSKAKQDAEQPQRNDTPPLPSELSLTGVLIAPQPKSLQQSDQPNEGNQRSISELASQAAAQQTKELEKHPQDQQAHVTDTTVSTSVDPMRLSVDNQGGALDGLLAQYHAAMQQVATANWIHSDQVPQLTHCHIRFTQAPGGTVTDISYEDCPFDAVARESIERAMHKSSMPYAGFEKAFSPQATVDFCYPEEACTK